MARKLTASILAALAVGMAGAAPAAAVPANITAAMADKSRPEADVKRDAARHPGEVLAFAGVKPGDKVADFMMGGGYWTDLLAPAVGPKGKVYAYRSAEFIAFRAAYGDEQKRAVAGRANVAPLTAPLSAVGLPDGLDLVLTVQNYHDMHLKPFPAGTAAGSVTPMPRRGIEMLHGVDMEVTVELGRTRMTVRDLLALTPGAVLELDRAAGSPADLLVNGRLIARGEVVVVDEDFGLRVTEIIDDSSAV